VRKGSGSNGKTNGQVRALPSRHSEEAGEALLQAQRGPRSDRLSVWFKEPGVRIELVERGITLLDGFWTVSLNIDGKDLDCQGTWESVCWNADEDADYLELQLELAGGVRIDRQLLLPRNGHLAIFADAVLAPGAKQVTYRAQLPVAAGLKLKAETLTREALLLGDGARARVYPLALPDERVNSTPDVLSEVPGRLELRQQRPCSTLYAPLVLDWSPERRRARALWRPLTVTEQGHKVSPEAAAGYRLQVGQDQWLVYHSLQNTGEARAVLGHHTWNETVIGTFGRDGEVKPLILVE
jgi:hypothetical protein